MRRKTALQQGGSNRFGLSVVVGRPKRKQKETDRTEPINRRKEKQKTSRKNDFDRKRKQQIHWSEEETPLTGVGWGGIDQVHHRNASVVVPLD